MVAIPFLGNFIFREFINLEGKHGSNSSFFREFINLEGKHGSNSLF